MPAVMQQPGEMAANAVSEAFNDEGSFCFVEADIPVAVRVTAAKKWLARMQYQGREHTFTLRAKSKDAAVTEAGIIYDTIRAAGWDATLLIQSLAARRGECLVGDEHTNYWIGRLTSRPVSFPPAGRSDQDWSVRLEHAGSGYWFPLGTANREAAAGKAREIYQTVFEQGWEAVFDQHARELVLSFEWCSSPVLWTYTTIHTLLGHEEFETPSSPRASMVNRVIVMEPDAGIRRALQWCVNQQAGFQCVSCTTPESLVRLCSFDPPSLVLYNRNLAGNFGSDLSAEAAAMQFDTLMVGYSVLPDGDQMFASMPGGAEGYLLKPVQPANIIEPVLGAVGRPNERGKDIVSVVKGYFKELLRARPDAGTRALARLTPREKEVLRLLSTGCSDREIARGLNISFWTVHEHLKVIYRRLGVRTRTAAAARYLE